MSSIDTTTPPEDVEAGTNRPGMLERPLSRVLRPDVEGHRLKGRPDLYTAYKQDMALLNTPAKRNSIIAVGVFALVLAFFLPNDLVVLFAGAYVLCIGAIGLNLVTGYAGQVSLGHAFFVGIGAYVAALVSGDPEGRLLGYGITFMPLWLLIAGLAAALAGALVAPLALRLKGLYLAIVTLGLVFLGEHIFKEARPITGGPGVGREAAVPSFGFGRIDVDGDVFGLIFLSKAQRLYIIALVLLVIMAVIARNIARSDVGRAFSAVRDRDIAAEVIGVDLTKVKILAFVLSSFYAGVAGALLFTITGFIDPSSFNLLLSIRFIAIVLIGGVATISGSIMGAMFVALLPRISLEIAKRMPEVISINEQLLEGLLYGVLIVVFLILEPRGLFGLWVRIRNYWKAWPFSY
jgi:branched-chain amino acid transport system permease protein